MQPLRGKGSKGPAKVPASEKVTLPCEHLHNLWLFPRFKRERVSNAVGLQSLELSYVSHHKYATGKHCYMLRIGRFKHAMIRGGNFALSCSDLHCRRCTNYVIQVSWHCCKLGYRYESASLMLLVHPLRPLSACWSPFHLVQLLVKAMFLVCNQSWNEWHFFAAQKSHDFATQLCSTTTGQLNAVSVALSEKIFDAIKIAQALPKTNQASMTCRLGGMATMHLTILTT